MIQTTIHPKACRQCGREFMPQRSMQAVCGQLCAMRKVRADKTAEKAEERAMTRKRREAIKTIADRIAEAQTAFNAYIRARDAGKPCICCGKPIEPQKPGGSMDAGHFRSRGSAPQLRFTEDNCFGQRKNCNRPGGTTYAAFRAGVVARIGEERTAAVEAANFSHKWTHEELIEIRARFIAKRKQLENA